MTTKPATVTRAAVLAAARKRWPDGEIVLKERDNAPTAEDRESAMTEYAAARKEIENLEATMATLRSLRDQLEFRCSELSRVSGRGKCRVYQRYKDCQNGLAVGDTWAEVLEKIEAAP